MLAISNFYYRNTIIVGDKCKWPCGAYIARQTQTERALPDQMDLDKKIFTEFKKPSANIRHVLYDRVGRH